MLFNSAQYLIFFLVVLSVSWLLAGRAMVRTWFILLASYYFYVSNNHWQILLLLARKGLNLPRLVTAKRRFRF